jgi:hypothetical protein
MPLFDDVIETRPDVTVEEWCTAGSLPDGETTGATGLDRILSCYHGLVEARRVQMGDLLLAEEERDLISPKLAALEQAVQGMASHLPGLNSLLATKGEHATCVLEALQMVRCPFHTSKIAIG